MKFPLICLWLAMYVFFVGAIHADMVLSWAPFVKGVAASLVSLGLAVVTSHKI